MFTFVTITYNHEKFIIMHLESIKYQVQSFFQNVKTALIISDDGSCDQTLRYCKSWIEKNRDIFEKVTILGDGTNRGTCRNLINAFGHLKSDRFFLLAGDDVYGYKNLLNVIKLLKGNDIISAPCPAFCTDVCGNYIIDTEYRTYKSNIARGLSHPLLYRAFTIAGCLTEAPPTVYRRSLLSKAVMDFTASFHLIEDQPLMYALLKERKIKLLFLDYAYVLYRIHSDSISHTNNEDVCGLAGEDLEKLNAYYAAHEKNLLYRYLIFLRRHMLQGSRWSSFLFPTNHYLVIKQKFFGKKVKQYYNKAVRDDSPKLLEHLQMLDKRAGEFRKICYGMEE